MKKIFFFFLLLILTFLFCPIISYAEKPIYFNQIPQKYSRFPFKANKKYTKKKSVLKKASKLNKKLLKTNKRIFYYSDNNSKELRAIISVLFGSYCSYIRKFDIEETVVETDDNLKYISDFKKLSKKRQKKMKYEIKKRYFIKILPKQYQKIKYRNKIVRSYIKLYKPQIGIQFMESIKSAVIKVNNFVCNYVDYDYSPKARHNAYFGFQDHLVLCMGYADICCILLNEIGIKAGTCGSEDHEWNWFKCGKEKFQLDACWNDTGNTNSYNYQKYFPDHNRIVDWGESHRIKIRKRHFK